MSPPTEAQFGDLAAKPPTFTSMSGDVYPTEAIKCAANLNGNVRYVWLDNTSGRDQFYVNGFDPATSTNASTGIGIDFVGLGSGSNSAKIVKDNNAILFVEGIIQSGHTLVSSTNEPLFPDMFDVAMDANFLYVVWEEDVLGVFSIHAAAVNLSSSAVTQLGTVGNGRRPTVSIDVRTAGGSAADIDVAYLTAVPGSINWAEWNGIAWTTFGVPALVTGTATSWSNATHARIVDASNPGQGTTDKAIYFIAEDHSGNVSLFCNLITSGMLASHCTYCDGTLITTQRSSGCPIETAGGFPVVDDYIRAFANPYDGANSPFDQFHCLYVLNHTSGIILPGSEGGGFPLMIINGTNSATGFCVSGDNIGGTFPFFDPSPAFGGQPILYQGAVNQMGFNVFWTGDAGGRLYHRRYERPIDQDITENTLLTAACEVSAGVSSTITLKNNWLTNYSDPTTVAMDQSPYAGSGQLTIDNGVTLDINPSTDGGGDFVVVGSETIIFSNMPMTGPLAGNNYAILAVDADDQMDFYANGDNAINGIGEFRFTGSGDYVVSDAYGTYAYTISDPAILNIHGGSTFESDISGTGNYFTCTDTKIHFNSETNVLTGTGTADGELILWNHSSFTKTWLISDDNGTASNPTIILINTNGTAGSGPPSWTDGTGNANYTSTPIPSFTTDTFEQCTFTTADTSHATVEILGRFVAPNSLIVDNGYVEGVSFISPAGGSGEINPYWPISFTNVEFDRIVQFGIDISFAVKPPDAEFTGYSLLVNGCGFQGYDNMTHFPNPDGIKVESAADVVTPGDEPTEAQDLLRQDITIENNDFPAAGLYLEPSGSVEAAIHFSDATGDILSNNIWAGMYRRGIWNESSTSTSHDLTWTFMCTNNIHSMENTEPELPALPSTDAAGISTDNYEGYIKSDTVYFCATGQIRGVNDIGHVVFSGYAHNYGPAFSGVDGSMYDITGVHHPGGVGDDPAYNIFIDNNSGGTQITLDQSVATTKVFLGQAGPGSGSWTSFGDNDIEGTTDVASSSTVSLVDIGNNYWGGGSFSESNITSTTDIAGDLPSQDISRGFTCSADDFVKRKGLTPASILVVDTPMSHCDSLLTVGYYDEQDGQMQNSYDTLRLFMEECPFYVGNKYNAGVASYEVFNYVGGAVSGWTTGGAGRWPDFLAWLKQVLYLNPDTQWYCNDVLQMITAFQSDEAAQEAAEKYIMESGKCPALLFATYYNAASYWRHENWLDSIVYRFDTVNPWGNYAWWVDSLVNQDTLAHPYDSTIPSLYQDSLQILMGPQYAGVSSPSPSSSQALLSAQLMENPTETDEIGVSYTMGRTALVTMQLLDVLGKSVPISNAQYLLQSPGTHEATLPVPNLPVGTYYLRLSTDVGDAITLKLVKE